ncbi:DUF1802 family protein [Schlesneria sp. T3-172]|uniref:DUF1802 family protein n=1 Tax=Schlesneria sphaerica TaxID=3373610 RepID=UPI0037C7C5AA
MESANRFAFKEWAVVCEALATGRQSLILRKGGIHEGREGFRVAHREFWLFPTGFHQQPDSVVVDAQPLLEKVLREEPPSDQVHVRHHAEVEQVISIQEESKLPLLRPWHIWSDETVSQRFHYKSPGLFAMLVRVHQLPAAKVLATSSHFAGCRSWVDFPDELPTTGLTPILSEEIHADRVRQWNLLF